MNEPLRLPAPEELAEILKDQLERVNPEQLRQSASEFVNQLLSNDTTVQRVQIDTLGLEQQQASAKLTQLLNTPLQEMSSQSSSAQAVTRSLESLRKLLNGLKPNNQQLESSSVTAKLSSLIGRSPVKQYFRRFETAQDTLNELIAGLEEGRERLKRDVITLSHDQEDMRQALNALSQAAEMGQVIDHQLVERIEKGLLEGHDQSFVEDELLFPLRQRILDLQQQQAVCRQGILAIELIIRNNRELVRGVDRALNVTLSALRVAVNVALALTNQKLVLDHIDALNDTTNQMIAETATALRRQGTEIQKRAVSAQLNMETLEKAFEEMQGALDEVSSYRRNALPTLQAQIERMQSLNKR
ncbi:toxic anion resistance protein [Nitrincola schmidtii]|uniref:toxic anion resistance protein n=1 Tax=Nitrincola schmidtii TaxID=1730894 RepID=UPI00145754A7|nr:toxic anion resistance protein [Nitrincola schmidtii]